MDLHLTQARAGPVERVAVDAVLGAPAPGQDERFAESGRAARGRRHLLLPALHAVQEAVGWISEGALNHIARRLSVPPAEVYGVATFYAMFATEQRAPRVVHVCDDVVCGPAGGEAMIEALTAELGSEGAGEKLCWQRSPCLGLCERAPAALVQQAGAPDFAVAPTSAEQVLTAELPVDEQFADTAVSAPQTGSPRAPGLRLLRRVGAIDPTSLDDYRAVGGYSALRRAVELGPSRVITEVSDAGLTGRGGAAGPPGVTGQGVATAAVRPHYLICNADESEPGTFKDRVLMESDPFGLVEAMTIAGLATGCELGYVYLRGEYPLAGRRLGGAIEAARLRGYLGPDVMGEGFAFDIELRRGAGAYICGEETALMNSIEGFRGEPRNKPPFPTVSGLFGKPTVVNNVETLYNVLEVLADGGPAFAAIGGGRSTGPKLFCVSGAVASPGVYEVGFGATLAELLELAGGVTGELRTVLLGGAAGGFVMPDQLDVPLTLEGTREIGGTLGSGVVLVFDTDADLSSVLRRIAAFFRDESCGQCVPCRVGTVRQEESLARLARGEPLGSRETELALLADLAQVMRDASICGLGHTAPAAVQSAISLNLLEVGR